MRLLALTLILILTSAISAEAQSGDEELIKQAGLNYLEGFYQGDSLKLKESLSPDLYKYGYWKGNSGEYGDGEQMTYQAAINYSKNVFESGRTAPETAPKKVEVLDAQEFIACIKITAWWGVDYALLAKKNGSWIIEQVLWQGPLSTVKS